MCAVAMAVARSRCVYPYEERSSVAAAGKGHGLLLLLLPGNEQPSSLRVSHATPRRRRRRHVKFRHVYIMLWYYNNIQTAKFHIWCSCDNSCMQIRKGL